jgi:enoyl-CoA hydratase/carnithine racemase
MPHLRCEIEQNLATIVLNNPPQKRLAPQMVDELGEILAVVGASEARALLFQASFRF